MTHYLSKYARFATISEMDEAVNEHISLHRNDLNKTILHILDVIRRYSVKYRAAHLKHETIEKAVGKSNATVRRALRKLEQLRIIERVHTVRPVLSASGANIYVILPFDDQGEMISPPDSKKPYDTGDSDTYFEKEPFSFQSNKKNILTDTSPTDEEKLSTSLFSKMKELLSGTIGDCHLAREFYGIHLAISRPILRFHTFKDDRERMEDLAYRALRITIMATKKKTIRRLPGYFSGVLQKLIDETVFKDTFQLYDKKPMFWLPSGGWCDPFRDEENEKFHWID